MSVTQIPVPADPEQLDEIEHQPEPIQLDREAILAAEDLPMRRIEVPEWGGFCYVRTLTGAERDRFEDQSIAGRGRDRRLSFRNLRARLVVMAACDERGQRIFRDEDVERLGRKSAAALDRVFAAAQKLSRFSEDDIEELVKNSDGDPSGDSGSS